MKKNLISIFAVAAITTAAGWNVMQSQSDEALSDVALANVEALADESSDCHYNNGYRSFSGSDGGAYDCCQIWRNGSVSGDCH
jgi:hypothetical protein